MNKSVEIYNYLLQNCIGYENRVKSQEVMHLFDVEDNKTFRSYIESARVNPECTYFIGSEAGKNGGYWIATSKREKRVTIENLILRAKKMLINAKTIRKKKLYERT